jgi:hypothetical protein
MDMNKFFTFFVLFSALAFAGCEKQIDADGSVAWEWKITNDTDAEIVVEVSSTNNGVRGPVAIPVGETKSILFLSFLTDPEPKPAGDYYANNSLPEIYMTTKIDGRFMSDEIWDREHWTFSSDVGLGTYTMTLTDELIEEFKEKIERPTTNE